MIFDMHCDVLFRLSKNPQLSFSRNNGLHITLSRLKEQGAKVQCMAIFISDQVPLEQTFSEILHQISIFNDIVLNASDKFVHVKSRREIDQLSSDQIGLMLSLEGCEGIQRDLNRLEYLFQCGVYSVGLTWNHANMCADGILESRGAGLTDLGKQVVHLNNQYKRWTDVSHLSIQSFWDVMDTADYPIASHSNALSLCSNPRNLNDDQIRALFEKNGRIGVTFVPQFLNDEADKASISDIVKHLDYLCSLGGAKKIGFGSDFDGIEETPIGLDHYGQYDKLINTCLQHFSEEDVKGFVFQNFFDAMPS